MNDTRLIERWLPIAAIGAESLRERTPMTPFPAPNRLHIWWARRPLVASRAAILASLLPEDADKDGFLQVLGIHGDPVESRARIGRAKRSGVRFEGAAYSYPRAFSYCLTENDHEWIKQAYGSAKIADIIVLDPTAGGGSIPFESARLRLKTYGNDLNPVAVLIEYATITFPLKHGLEVHSAFRTLADEFVRRREEIIKHFFPAEPNQDSIPTNYLWARTITCPYCDGLIPLSPNWRLSSEGTGVRLHADTKTSRCTFEVVSNLKEHSNGTVADGDATCPYPNCGRIINGEEIKSQAQAGHMGDQLFAIVYKKRIVTRTKSGKPKVKWERGYRAPVEADEVSEWVAAKLAGKLPEWEALDIVPTEKVPEIINDDRPIQYGMPLWRDMFSPRQLLCHGTNVEVFRELLQEEEKKGLSDVTKAAFVYLSLSLDKLRDYNSRMSRWQSNREVTINTFDRHDFSFKWSYAEMSSQVVGVGHDWAIEQIERCIRELVVLVRPDAANSGVQSGFDFQNYIPPPVELTCKAGDSLDHIAEASVDVVVMDPPYYDNVMYAELSDFFYVWLKRTAGYVYPDLFRRQLTDKENEAVANPAKYKGQKGAKVLAGKEYQERMASIFAECRRVLKSSGIMTLMFTHKATGAWDALTKGLMQAGFTITASWPINTEAEGSMHIKDKAAANSTIFLVCRPRTEDIKVTTAVFYWEDVEPLVAQAVRSRVKEFQDAGIGGVDLYLASFGPALEEFSKHWPLKRGTPRPVPEERKRRRQSELFEEEYDPYLVTPEDALDAARREVKRWRLEQLTHLKASGELDPITSFFVLAWDAFRAPAFDYDEALRLARAVGVDLDKDIVGRLAEKKASNIHLWDSARRAAKGALGPTDGSRGMIDAIHHTANMARSRTLAAAKELLEKVGLNQDQSFFAALEAVLEVLPVSKAFTGIDLEGDVAAQGNDFEALENLRRLAFTEQVDEPGQLKLWKDVEV